ncbi:MAG: YihY/virulence factor BrkB family protein [Prevotella sp.]|nr:YihY/virulence factor BrkB family protein [Prevotella sp.]MDD4534871.1 YihY/virulence factor BrkB family protein [Prevotella sp.]
MTEKTSTTSSSQSSSQAGESRGVAGRSHQKGQGKLLSGRGRLAVFFRRTIWRRGNVKFREDPLTFLAQRLYVVFQGLFVEKHWGYAAQLTFNTMMAIIPLFAVIFAVGRGFGFEAYITDWLRRVMVSQPQVADAILTLADSYIKYTHTGVVIGVSLVFMLYSVVSLFDNIESVFNGIWGVKKERNFAKAAVDYVSIIFLVPLVIILLSGLSVFFQSILGRIPDFQVLTPLLRGLIGLAVPLLLLTIFFTLMYTYLPNTRVRMRMVWFPALLAAITTAGLQAVYIHFQILFTSYSVIYGSLAALPLLMLWLQLSWFICIGFAELGRANQELADGHIGEDRRESLRERIRKSVVVAAVLADMQRKGSGPASLSGLIRQTRYSHAQTTRSLRMLVEARLVARTHREDDSDVYTLNRSASDLGVGRVIHALLGRLSPHLPDDPLLTMDIDTEQEMDVIFREIIKQLDHIPASMEGAKSSDNQ